MADICPKCGTEYGPGEIPVCGFCGVVALTGAGIDYLEGQLAAKDKEIAQVLADYTAQADVLKKTQRDLNAWRGATRLAHLLPSRAREKLDGLRRQLTEAKAENNRLVGVELEWLAERKAITTALGIELKGIPKGKACAGLGPVLEAIENLSHSYRCYHCGETFTEKEAAEKHFGVGDPGIEEPECVAALRAERDRYTNADDGHEFVCQVCGESLEAIIHSATREAAQAATASWPQDPIPSKEEALRGIEKAAANLRYYRKLLEEQPQ